MRQKDNKISSKQILGLLWLFFLVIVVPIAVAFVLYHIKFFGLFNSFNLCRKACCIVVATVSLLLYIYLLYSTIVVNLLSYKLTKNIWNKWPFHVVRNYIESLRKEDDQNVCDIFKVQQSDLSSDALTIISSIADIDALIKENNDNEEVNNLIIPHLRMDENGSPTLDGFWEILKECEKVKPKERKNIIDYAKLKIKRNVQAITVKELASIIADTPLYADVSTDLQELAHDFHIDQLMDSVQDLGHDIKDITSSVTRDLCGDTFADYVSDVHIPLFGSLFEGFKQGGKIIDGDIDIEEAIKQSGTKIGMKTVFGSIGTAIGSLGGPFGAMVCGFIGNYLGSLISNDIKCKRYNEMVADLKSYESEFRDFITESQTQLDDMQKDVSIKVSKCIDKKERQLERLKKLSPLDGVDVNIFYSSICIVIRDYILEEILCKKKNQFDIIKCLPADRQIKSNPKESLFTLLYAIDSIEEDQEDSLYYNRQLVLGQCAEQVYIDYLNLFFTQNKWLMDVYDKYYNAVNDITRTYLDGNKEISALIGEMDIEKQKRQNKLEQKLDEVKKEERKIK